MIEVGTQDYGITKDELVLHGNTVKYANCFEIQDILEYDFNMEKQQKYSKMSRAVVKCIIHAIISRQPLATKLIEMLVEMDFE